MAIRGITIHEILNKLGCKERSSSNGEYKCRCPAHDDKRASLTIREGEKGIVMKCHAGCDCDRICARLDMQPKDLFWDDNPKPSSFSKVKRPAKQAPTPPPAPAKDKASEHTYMSYQAAYSRIDGKPAKFECAYPYRNSAGVLKFEVARIRLPDGGKTFRQHRPVTPDGSGKCAFPIRKDVPSDLRDTIIYRQAETEEAVRSGRTIYVVEGEKDADTMARLGMIATTNPGGGGEGQWKDGHTEHLKGAKEVIILPDNDETGEGHGAEVFRKLSKVIERVYIVRLKDGYPDLKKKGDFTDLTEAVGDARAVEILRELEAIARENLWQKAQRAYANIPGYGIDHGRICQLIEGEPKQLCNFVALPTEIVEIDDGVTVEKSMRVAGWNVRGRQLPTLLVPLNKFRSMDWALERWDVEANIMPGNTVKDKLRWVMTEAGFKVAERKTIYSHCGWRRIGGRWAYIHQGGCIGAEGVEVDMGNNLGNYTLANLPENVTAEDAAITSYSLTTNLPASISVPMLGVTYLAPLVEFLDQVLCPPSFITALIGQQGTHKTGVAALFLNHFGRFGIRGMPANFTSTKNAIRNSAFAAKDTMLVIDDYFPASSLQERKRMEDIMQTLSRAFGDKAVRGRLNADLSAQAAKPARGLAVITGETVPDVGASGQARMYMINFDKSSYSYTDDMAKLWKDAEDGVLRLAMAKYIEWLLPQAEDLPAMMRDMFSDYRRKAHQMIAGAATNDRADDSVAHIMIGLTMMARWMASLGLMADEAVEATLAEWWSDVIGNVKLQGTEGRDESPTAMFMTAVQEMLISGAISVVDITPGSEVKNPDKQTNVGFIDGTNYYFLPDKIMGWVVDFYRRQDRLFPLSKNALFKIMREDGIIEQWDEKGNRSTRQKNINGRNARYLWIPRWRVDGRKEPDDSVQLSMEKFQEVDDPELPFE